MELRRGPLLEACLGPVVGASLSGSRPLLALTMFAQVTAWGTNSFKFTS